MQRADLDQWKSSEVSRLLALVETERRYYQDIFAQLPVAVAIVDSEWGLSAVNREFRRRFGLRNADLSRMRLPDLLPDPQLEAALADVLKTGTPRVNHPVQLGGDSSALRLTASIQRIPGWQAGAEDELLLTIDEDRASESSAPAASSVPDIDPLLERRRRREVIEESKRGAIERLSGRLAHVANNLLMIIGGYAEELMESLPADDTRRDDVAEIVKASARMGALTHDLTSLTRPPVPVAAPFSLVAWATTAVARWRLASATDTDFQAHTSRQLLDVIIFETLRHLRPEPGTPELRITPLDGCKVEIALHLPGLAVSEETCDRLFEPFSGPKEGTDPPLGLAGLVRPWQALEGTITFEAQPGEAPRLILTCPRACETPQPAAPVTVLVVEDEPGIRSLICKALDRQGYRVTQASSADEAIKACEEGEARIDLLVTDLTMPGQTGRELAERVRAKWPATRVLFISGFTDDTELAAQIGARKLPEQTRFLAKPFHVAQLITEVKTLLAG
ncbi:PAS domain-containing sensor histidine kinase [Paludibaculum fermentans]|uniref:Response regulator n=1 Tax=Paludibaculum fermentans TaxID=1473598 RepID=A0A7S7NLG7_PALFE|nr:PAS domain-containing sensor histidine kinase [Paludibaculum fermentans]QOY85744.1 response regulator [Paludibaculum fermentans]